ncbi:unnamed protein product [Phaedon cochleariae]|uniref:Peptidase S1 domain-containing protein n=1 Tax=Phaedon cochleariae TaxID=80249 RepID=A0A9N9X3H7_PHACE|nr:unnamed protein product [Phaedon cochleariae]
MLQVPIIAREKCQSAYPGTVVTLNMFCVGWMTNGNRTSCEGDYGGPGIVRGTLQGVVSWGRGCGVAKWPTVLTKVVNFVGWIKETTGTDVGYLSYA